MFYYDLYITHYIIPHNITSIICAVVSLVFLHIMIFSSYKTKLINLTSLYPSHVTLLHNKLTSHLSKPNLTSQQINLTSLYPSHVTLLHNKLTSHLSKPNLTSQQINVTFPNPSHVTLLHNKLTSHFPIPHT